MLGRVEAGSVEKGEEILVLPAGYYSRVLEIVRYGEKRKNALTGESIGIVLEKHGGVERGVVLAQHDHVPVVSDEMDVTMFWMGDVPLNRGDEVTLQCSTQVTLCRLKTVEQRIDSSTLHLMEENGKSVGPNEVGRVVFKLNRPIVFEPFGRVPELGRLVLRKGDAVCAAGIVGSVPQEALEQR